VGYPDRESEMGIIQGRQTADPYAGLKQVINTEAIRTIQNAVLQVTIKDELVGYITDLVSASRANSMIELGISPRGAIAVSHMAKASAIMNGRDYVTEEDIRDVFTDVCAHRIILTQKARAASMTAYDVLQQIIAATKTPFGI
jgi:MoxR-like ATPase